MSQEKIKDVCDRTPDPNKLHMLDIVKDTGKIDGIPTWRCRHCKQETKAS